LRIVDIENVQLDVGRFRKIRSNISDDLFQKTSSIVSTVERMGDSALMKYTQELDGVKLASLRVSEDEIRSAFRSVSNMP
jgi:histidinol dehydrogenase